MSCGNPHETPCVEVLDRVYGYLDGELDDADYAKIRQHLDECGPCLREYGLEEAVKRLVAKHCGCDPAPAQLREKVLVRIRELRATIEFAELPPLPDWRESVTIAPYAADSIAQCDHRARRLSGEIWACECVSARVILYLADYRRRWRTRFRQGRFCTCI